MKAFLLGVVVVMMAVPVLAQDRVVVDIAGDDTCTAAAGEKGFDALTWQVGGTDAVNIGSASTGAGAGKPKLQDLVITRNQDACSEKLIRDFVSGTILPTVTLTQYRALKDGQLFAAVTVTLTNSVLAGYSISGATGIRPSENLDFAYSKVCVATIAQNSDGSLQGPQKVCYNVATNMVN
jgi:type VI protein secretion system component Hcp